MEQSRIHRRDRRVDFPRNRRREEQIGGLRLARGQRLVDRAPQQRVAQHGGGIFAEAVPRGLVGALHRAVGADQDERLGQPLGDGLFHPEQAVQMGLFGAAALGGLSEAARDPVDFRQARRRRRESDRDALQPPQILAQNESECQPRHDFRADQPGYGADTDGSGRHQQDVARDRDGQDQQQPPADTRSARGSSALAGPAECGRAQLPGTESDFGAGWTICEPPPPTWKTARPRRTLPSGSRTRTPSAPPNPDGLVMAA